jgi:DmsE family decaheme c-type cytochrome
MTAIPALGQPSPAFAGSEACGTCHEDIAKAFAKSPHHLADTEKKWGSAGHACESCHGPGQKHAESADAALIRNPAKLTAPAIDRICLTCHLNQPTHVGRLQSSHARDAIACTTCHAIHGNGAKELVARAPAAVNELCSGCHVNVWAQFQQPNHHRLPEGAMACVDCHNPHGSSRPFLTRAFAANEPGCANCHGDKRGPFAFEHAPVRFEV